MVNIGDMNHANSPRQPWAPRLGLAIQTLSRPFLLGAALATVLLPALGLGGAWVILNWERETLVKLHFLLLAASAGLLILLAFIRANQLAKLRAGQRNMVLGLANLAELRDPGTGRHLERTRGYGVILARSLRKLPKFKKIIDDRFIADLYEAAPLHDLGKVGIPDRVLLKPGRLDEEEFQIIRRHSEVGARILEDIIAKLDDPEPFLAMSVRIARHHHEKFNGKGYPDGLAGEEIPLEARIYALGDAYDAIRARRPYKDPVTHLEAVQRIYAGRGSHFDPDVVDAFLHTEELFVELFETYQVYEDVYLQMVGAGDGGQGGAIEPAVVWTSEFEIGVESIDRQHRELIERINRLLAAIRQGQGHEAVSPLVAFLQEYVIEHFRSEEALMRRHHYPDYEAHKALHDGFVAELKKLVAQLNRDGIQPEHVVVLNRRVINWVVEHIFLVDRGLQQYHKKTAEQAP